MKKSRWVGGVILLYQTFITFMIIFGVTTEWRKRYLILKGSKLFFAKVRTVTDMILNKSEFKINQTFHSEFDLNASWNNRLGRLYISEIC